MVDLTAKSPTQDLLPLKFGPLSLTEVDLGAMTLIVAFDTVNSALSQALKLAHGIAAPASGRTTGKAGCRAIWFGKDQVLLAGPEPSAHLKGLAALSDQSDAWTCLELKGAGAEDVLARLVPIDLRSSQFKRGYTARTLIGHMAGSVTSLGADRYLVMVFRSMAGTLVHDVSEAMETVLARS